MLSPRNLAGDHDALVTEYYSRGFDQVAVTITQQPEPADASKVDVVFHIDEGEQIFVRNVLLTGLELHAPADRGAGHHAARRRPAQPNRAR